MRRNYLLLSLLGFFVVSYAAPDERRKFVRVITEPKPGEEYVSIHTGKPSSPGGHRRTPLADDDMTVAINDEGQTGIKEVTGPVPTEEKIYAHKKIYPIVEDEPMKRTKQEKKYTEEVTPEIFVSKSINNKLNKNRRDGDITTHSPSKVHKNLNSNSEDDGLYDFVDSPYGGQLVGSASSQASRVNIKKAPNGQEYEYEYVYYYYDEDEEHPKSGSKTGQSASNSTPQQQSNTKPNKETNSKPKKPAVVQDENQFVQNTNKGRFSAIEHTISSEEPEGHGNFAVNDIAEHNSKTKESARNLEEALSVPSSSLAVSEERLPHNPRFPARSRGNTRPPPEIETTLPLTDTPITRIRGGNTGTHQPGLDLVDSNAFRTHSSSGQHMSTSPRHESVRGNLISNT